MTPITALLLSLSATVLWHDPGAVEKADLSRIDKPPKPPYTFLREDLGGTSPKVYVRDAAGVQWRVKGGKDSQVEPFVTRIVNALGYYAEAMVFSPQGRIENVPGLKRASGFIQPDGSYSRASFERVEPEAQFAGGWSWIDPALRQTRELKGLKVLVMLFSNWDNKDSRDVHAGSNTSILEFSDGRRVYFVNDWGQSLGAWGRIFGRKNWDCGLYQNQSRAFVTGVSDGYVHFGYAGAHTLLFRNDIRVEDVRWLMRYLGRLTDAQIRAALESVEATPAETNCYTSALRSRIERLRKVTLE